MYKLVKEQPPLRYAKAAYYYPESYKGYKPTKPPSYLEGRIALKETRPKALKALKKCAKKNPWRILKGKDSQPVSDSDWYDFNMLLIEKVKNL